MQYDPAIKHELIIRLLSGESAGEISRNFGISRSTLYRRKNETDTIHAKGKLYTVHDIAVLERRVAKYIDFYNNKRPHSTMNHKTPAQVEQAYYATKTVSRQGSD